MEADVSRRETLLTEWLTAKGYDKIAVILGPEFSVKYLRLDNREGLAEISWDSKETKEKADLIAKRFDEDKDFLRELYKKCYDICNSLILTSKIISESDLPRKSNDELLALFKDCVEKFGDFMVPLQIVFPIENFLTRRSLDRLRNEFKDESEVQKYFRFITTPNKESDIFLEQKDLLEIAIMQKNSRNIKERMKIHAENFGWMGAQGNSFLSESWDENYFYKKLNEIKNPEEKLKLLLENRKRELEDYKDAINSLSEELKETAEIFQELILLRTYRITVFKKAHLNIKPLLEEIAKRFGISFEDIVWYKTEEIENLIKNNIRTSVMDRKRSHSVIRENGIVRLEEGVDQTEDVASVDIIKGVAANKGKAEGIVKIIYSAKEADKMENGNILVTRMTVPDMIIAIEKAAAIVTDEGGFTSHAVMISRELGKPCIIATKIATKVLKDGDIVRVDAENGTIEKLNT